MLKSNVVPLETGRHASDEALRVAEQARDEALLAADEAASAELTRAEFFCRRKREFQEW